MRGGKEKEKGRIRRNECTDTASARKERGGRGGGRMGKSSKLSVRAYQVHIDEKGGEKGAKTRGGGPSSRVIQRAALFHRGKGH